MIARRIAWAIATAAMTIQPAMAAPPFPPVPDGFVATPFRGLSMGQTRAEVEAALSAIGKRCYTEQEVQAGGTPPVEGFAEYQTCRIGDAGPPPEYYQMGMNQMLNVELVFGLPVYAISFLEGKAAAISLLPEFFNATGTSPYAFASAIAENYPIGQLEPTDSGWRGVTANGELIQIWTAQIRFIPLWMTIFLSTDANSPSFD